jgi:hypothetical protein
MKGEWIDAHSGRCRKTDQRVSHQISTMSSTYDNCERRHHPRWDFGLGLKGSIVSGINLPTRPCTIKNISHGGARLDIGLLLDLPHRFTLLMSSTANHRRECKVIWRSEFEAGIKLLDRCLQSAKMICRASAPLRFTN